MGIKDDGCVRERAYISCGITRWGSGGAALSHDASDNAIDVSECCLYKNFSEGKGPHQGACSVPGVGYTSADFGYSTI